MTAPTMPGQILGYARAAQPTKSNVKAQPGSGTRKSGGSSGRRIVRTAAGAARYHVPIGSEIRPARNEASKRFQNNKPARQRYQNLVGRDPRKQAAELKKLNRTQLTRLTALAWSFKSKDANVTRLRTALTKELYNRGINVRTYLAEVGIRGKSLGRGSAFRHSKDRHGRPMPGTVEDEARKKANLATKKKRAKPGGPARGRSGATAPVRRAGPPPIRKTKSAPKPSKVVSRVAARKNDRRLTQLSNVDQLRKAVKAFGRVRPESRQAAARFIVRQAVELAAVHVLGESVIEAANLPEKMNSQVIELAGRWKHGYIPLDATAMRIKMKGGNGKPWWSGGKQKRRGSKESMRKSTEAGKTARTMKANRAAAPKAKAEPSRPKLGTREGEKDLKRRAAGGDREALAILSRRHQANQDAGSGIEKPGSPDRTNVVKSGSAASPTRGTKVNKPEPRNYLRSGMGSGPANQHVAPKARSGKPEAPHAIAVNGGSLGNKIQTPKGLDAYTVKGDALYHIAVFKDGGHVGYIRKGDQGDWIAYGADHKRRGAYGSRVNAMQAWA